MIPVSTLLYIITAHHTHKTSIFLTLVVLLFTQDLREECLKLRTRVFDLEQQNRALGILFQQRIKPASDLLLQVCYPLN